MGIKRKLLIPFLFSVIIFSQDEVFLKNGKKIIAKVDISSINSNDGKVRIKKRFESDYSFLYLSSVNFIKSWNGIMLYPKGVIVNSKSNRIHLPTVEHLPIESDRLKFASKDEAEKKGFSVCTACFDNSPILSDLDIELELTKETVLAIQNTNEIMYEHEKLPVLQKYVEKVLSNWPEKLKGYDYRIQIIRDKSPNAMAIAGGNLYFTTGLIDMVENDTEMEAVVAHEIAHVERRHSLRGYKEYLRKKNIAAVAGIALGLIAANNSKSDNVQIATAAAALATGYALEFAQKGYERDLEQEADMFAQVYLSKINESSVSMLNTLDKLATHTGSRIGYTPKANAYSSHPDIMSRMKQVRHGKLTTYDKPVEISFNAQHKKVEMKNGFINMNVNYIYIAPSSEDPWKREIMIAGTIYNNDLTYSYKIDEIKLNFIETLGVTKLDGLVDIVVPRSGEIDFVGRVQSKFDQVETIIGNFNKKYLIPYGGSVTAVIIKPGESIKGVGGMAYIKCGIAVK
tara:strand:- start:559 stop:2097 length:1539 start_codon:yes stop_codon:yes gene_type:complete